MKAPQRSALLAAGFAAAAVASASPSVAGAQRQQLPGPDTRRVLVTTFRGDAEGGVKAANEIRDRIGGEYSVRTLIPNSKKDIDVTLTNSGYKPDSALSPSDIKELSRLLHTDEIIDGEVTKLSANNYRVTARLLVPRDIGLRQPLGTFEGNNFGNFAKQIVDEYDRARKQISDNQACENGIRANTPAVAIAAARKGIASYPKAALVRLCLASAYSAMKNTADSSGSWKDSVIAITNSITAVDPGSRIAWQLQYDAYKAKNDTMQVSSLLGLMQSDPTNTTLVEQVIATLVQQGKAKQASDLAKKLVADNAGDIGFARLYWQVLRAIPNYKESVPAGIAYAALDTSVADTSYYFRQISDLGADSAFARAAEFASVASAKYPKRTDFLLLKAQNERKAGQLPAAKATLERVIALDPKTPLAAAQLATVDNDLGMQAEAVTVLKASVAADPTQKERNGALALSFGNTLFKAAQASKSVDDYKKAIPILQAADEISPSASGKFLLAASAYSVVSSQATELQKSKSCEDFKAANDLLTIVQINMPAGASVSKEYAAQVLGALPQFQAFVDGNLKNLKCK